MPKILITGGAGFVGSNTAKAFADKGYSVVATTRGAINSAGSKLSKYSDLISVESCDLKRSAEVAELFSRHSFDGMVITAAAHQDATSRPMNNAIYDMMLNCLDAASFSGVKRVVMAGSMAVYGGEIPPFSEETAFSPEISYEGERGHIQLPKFEVRIKRIVEQMLLDYGTPLDNPTGSGGPAPEITKNKPHTLEVAVLRLPFQFGPGYARMGNPLAIAAHAVAGRIKNVNEVRGYMNIPLLPLWSTMGALVSPLYVKDTASALLRVIEAEKLPHRIYNVTGNYSTSVKEQVEALYRAAPEAREIIGFAPEELPDEDKDMGANPDLIKKDLGWTPSYTMEQAFKDYIGWLRDKDNLY